MDIFYGAIRSTAQLNRIYGITEKDRLRVVFCNLRTDKANRKGWFSLIVQHRDTGLVGHFCTVFDTAGGIIGRRADLLDKIVWQHQGDALTYMQINPVFATKRYQGDLLSAVGQSVKAAWTRWADIRSEACRVKIRVWIWQDMNSRKQYIRINNSWLRLTSLKPMDGGKFCAMISRHEPGEDAGSAIPVNGSEMEWIAHPSDEGLPMPDDVQQGSLGAKVKALIWKDPQTWLEYLHYEGVWRVVLDYDRLDGIVRVTVPVLSRGEGKVSIGFCDYEIQRIHDSSPVSLPTPHQRIRDRLFHEVSCRVTRPNDLPKGTARIIRRPHVPQPERGWSFEAALSEGIGKVHPLPHRKGDTDYMKPVWFSHDGQRFDDPTEAIDHDLQAALEADSVSQMSVLGEVRSSPKRTEIMEFYSQAMARHRV